MSKSLIPLLNRPDATDYPPLSLSHCFADIVQLVFRDAKAHEFGIATIAVTLVRLPREPILQRKEKRRVMCQLGWHPKRTQIRHAPTIIDAAGIPIKREVPRSAANDNPV